MALSAKAYEEKIDELREKLAREQIASAKETGRANGNRQALHMFIWLALSNDMLQRFQVQALIEAVVGRRNAAGILLPLEVQHPIDVDIGRIAT